jgi:hypothetical protein
VTYEPHATLSPWLTEQDIVLLAESMISKVAAN